ncbi:MAG: OmpA family protein, partial [Ignavibacteria bacterium]
EKSQEKDNGKGGIGRTYKLRRVFFDHDKWDIKQESVEELNKLKSYLTKNPDLCVRLDAHTDSNGSNEYNKELSRKRAQSVVDYLIGNGIDPTRLSAQGFGEEYPVSTNDTPEGREENRRVEFTKMGC